MGWDFAIFGELQFPDDARRVTWLSTTLNPSQHTDWTGPISQVSSELAGSTVEQVLARIQERAIREQFPLDVEVTLDGASAKVRGYLDKDAAADGLANELAVMFRSAAPLQAKGELHFVGVANTISLKVSVENGASSYDASAGVLEDEPRVLEIVSWGADRVMKRVAARSGSKKRRR